MPGGSRSLPGRPSLRHLKLEAKRRLATGEFPSLHEAQVAIAREHGLPNWTALKQRVCDAPESHALDQLRWVIARFSGAGEPGWTAPAEDELRLHFDERFLSVIPPPALIATISNVAADLRGDLVVLGQTPEQAYVQLQGMHYIAVTDAEPPHRLTGLRGIPVGSRVHDPRIADPPVRTQGSGSRRGSRARRAGLHRPGPDRPPPGRRRTRGRPRRAASTRRAANMGPRPRLGRPGPPRAPGPRSPLPGPGRHRPGHRHGSAQAGRRGPRRPGRSGQRSPARGPAGR